jgi:hypothetical protein
MSERQRLFSVGVGVNKPYLPERGPVAGGILRASKPAGQRQRKRDSKTLEGLAASGFNMAAFGRVAFPRNRV